MCLISGFFFLSLHLAGWLVGWIFFFGCFCYCCSYKFFVSGSVYSGFFDFFLFCFVCLLHFCFFLVVVVEFFFFLNIKMNDLNVVQDFVFIFFFSLLLSLFIGLFLTSKNEKKND